MESIINKLNEVTPNKCAFNDWILEEINNY